MADYCMGSWDLGVKVTGLSIIDYWGEIINIRLLGSGDMVVKGTGYSITDKWLLRSRDMVLIGIGLSITDNWVAGLSELSCPWWHNAFEFVWTEPRELQL